MQDYWNKRKTSKAISRNSGTFPTRCRHL